MELDRIKDGMSPCGLPSPAPTRRLTLRARVPMVFHHPVKDTRADAPLHPSP